MSGSMYGDIDVSEVTRAVHSAIDHGINLFDTAEVYGPFHSEILLGKALGDKRKEVIIVDKVGFSYDESRDESSENFGGVLGRHSEYHHIIKRAEGCLRRLNTDVIDLMLIHWPDFNTALDEPMRALEKLKTDGKIRYCGVSNFNTEMMEVSWDTEHWGLGCSQERSPLRRRSPTMTGGSGKEETRFGFLFLKRRIF